jgi:hypothetical protein
MYNLSRWGGIRRAAHRLLNTRLCAAARRDQIGEYDAKKVTPSDGTNHQDRAAIAALRA